VGIATTNPTERKVLRMNQNVIVWQLSQRDQTEPLGIAGRSRPSLTPNALELAELIAAEPQLAEEVRPMCHTLPRCANDARCLLSPLLLSVPKAFGPIERQLANRTADGFVAADLRLQVLKRVDAIPY